MPKKSVKHPLEKLRNLGPKMARYLVEVGIPDEDTLRKIGPVEAYFRISTAYPHLVNRMALYALYGALTDQDCMRLPNETRQWLEEQITK